MELTDIEVGNAIGAGHFGSVHKGKWQKTTDVALKKLKSKDEAQAFQRELKVLMMANHLNIVRLYGKYTSPEGDFFLVFEFMRKGSLDKFLIKHKSLGFVQLLEM